MSSSGEAFIGAGTGDRLLGSRVAFFRISACDDHLERLQEERAILIPNVTLIHRTWLHERFKTRAPHQQANHVSKRPTQHIARSNPLSTRDQRVDSYSDENRQVIQPFSDDQRVWHSLQRTIVD